MDQNPAPSTSRIEIIKLNKNKENNQNTNDKKFFVRFTDKKVAPSLTNHQRPPYTLKPNALSNYFKKLTAPKEKPKLKSLLGCALEDDSSNQEETNLAETNTKLNKTLIEINKKLPELIAEPINCIENPILADTIEYLCKINEHNLTHNFKHSFENKMKLVSFISEILESNKSISDSFTVAPEFNHSNAFSVWKNLHLFEELNKKRKNPSLHRLIRIQPSKVMTHLQIIQMQTQI